MDGRAKVREFIVASWLNGDDRDFDDATDLQQSGVLDSFSTMDLVSYLEKTFDVQFDPADINSETFRTVETIARLVTDKLATRAGDRSS